MMHASEARNNFSELVNEVEYTHEPVLILKHGKMAAVMISHHDYSKIRRYLPGAHGNQSI
ncbi:MAG: type II toxin-antitoxin system Phd/YefM family antitoxin [Thermoleophilia bacterium]|nr:type II toxin-antitoxin system Phd/YefM family antitoxin [Thermoleophilia bacterium]